MLIHQLGSQLETRAASNFCFQSITFLNLLIRVWRNCKKCILSSHYEFTFAWLIANYHPVPPQKCLISCNFLVYKHCFPKRGFCPCWCAHSYLFQSQNDILFYLCSRPFCPILRFAAFRRWTESYLLWLTYFLLEAAKLYLHHSFRW